MERRYIPNTAIDKDQFDLMWQFLQFKQQESNPEMLALLCENLRCMMMQKTGGQEPYKKKDDVPFDDLSTIMCGIIIEAMSLYLSGDLARLYKPYEEGQNVEEY